ncbi:MAG: hypothetical protein LIP08_16005 [Bacteroides sp.]|nr:hypothetical protein [Bacteroides sp.]
MKNPHSFFFLVFTFFCHVQLFAQDPAQFVPVDVKSIPNVYDAYLKNFLNGRPTPQDVKAYFDANHMSKAEMEHLDFKRAQFTELHARDERRLIKGPVLHESEAGKAFIIHGTNIDVVSHINRIATFIITVDTAGKFKAARQLCQVEIGTPPEIRINARIENNIIYISKVERDKVEETQQYVNHMMLIYNK